MIDLAALNQRELISHRERAIERSYQASGLRRYAMPRRAVLGSEESFEEIPAIYDLHSQNQGRRTQTIIQPLNHLITLNSKPPSTTHPNTHKHTPSPRIHCTLGKQSSRQSVRSAPKSSWWCCLKEEGLEQFETRELSLRQGSRHSGAFSGMVSLQLL